MARVVDREDERIAESLRTWMAGQAVGPLRPLEVRKRRDADSAGQEAWFFEVVLPDPEPVKGTWPVEDLAALDLATRDQAIEQRLAWPWYVLFVPETDEPQEDEDEIPTAG